MRKVIVTEFMTLDGVIETPHHWSFPFWNDQVAKFKHNELFSSGALLLGRVTYEQFVAAWPSRTDDTGFADKINSLPKHVASRTLDRVEWNAKLLGEPLVEEIGRLKEEPGGDLVVHGSANLVQTLLAANLVDQLNLLVYPLVLGKGQRLFPGGIKAGFKLVEATPVDTGVIISIYERIEE